jgi:hypothetical protein
MPAASNNSVAAAILRSGQERAPPKRGLEMMIGAKQLPAEHFADYSFVF